MTARDSDDQPIAGWADLPVDPATGVLDLSSLLVSQTGLQPTFVVSFTDGTDGVGTVGELRFTTAAPQLCVDLVVQENPCPTGVGVGSAAFPATAKIGRAHV